MTEFSDAHHPPAHGPLRVGIGGPVGLAVVLLLKARGVRTVVASDLSPARRELARACGDEAWMELSTYAGL